MDTNGVILMLNILIVMTDYSGKGIDQIQVYYKLFKRS